MKIPKFLTTLWMVIEEFLKRNRKKNYKPAKGNYAPISSRSIKKAEGRRQKGRKVVGSRE